MYTFHPGLHPNGDRGKWSYLRCLSGYNGNHRNAWAIHRRFSKRFFDNAHNYIRGYIRGVRDCCGGLPLLGIVTVDPNLGNSAANARG